MFHPKFNVEWQKRHLFSRYEREAIKIATNDQKLYAFLSRYDFETHYQPLLRPTLPSKTLL